MLRAIILTLLLSFNFRLSAMSLFKYSCIFKLSMNDCITCYEGLNYTSNFNNCSSVIIVQEVYKDQLDEIREVKLAGKPYFPISASDSIYHSLKGYSTSSFHLFNKGEQIFSCALKTMPLHLDEIKRLLYNKSDSISLERRLPNNFRWSCGSETIFMYDQNFYNITAIPINSPGESYKIKNGDQLSLRNYQLHLDSAETIRVNKMMSALKLPLRGRIEDFYNNGDTCYFIIQNNYPVDTLLPGRTTKDTLIMSIFSLIKMHQNKVLEISPVKNPYHNFNYSFIQYSFFVHNGVSYFSMSNNNPNSKESKFLSAWNTQQKALRFNRFLKFELPEIHHSQHLGYNFATFEYHYPYVMNKIGCEIYNIETETTRQLPLNYKLSNFADISHYKVTLNYVVADFTFTNDTLKIITREFEKFHLYTIRLSDNKLLRVQPLLPEYERIDLAGEPKFFDNQTVCYILKKNATIYFKTYP